VGHVLKYSLIRVTSIKADIRTFFTSGSLREESVDVDNSKIRYHALKSATNQTLRIEDSVAGVHGSLIFGGITNETLFRREGDI